MFFRHLWVSFLRFYRKSPHLRLLWWKLTGVIPEDGGVDVEMIFCCGLCGRVVDGWQEGGTDDEYCDECWVNAHRSLLETGE